MANKILIKSGSGTPANGVLDTAELGFDKTNNKLYIGNNGSVIDLIGTDWFKKGEAIPSNSDLNNYNTPGKYNVSSTAISKTILNSPVTNDNFVLFVFARTTSNSTSLTQMLISLGSSLYIRNNNSSGEWRDWVKYARASEVITNLSASGETITYTKGDGTTGTITTSTTSAATATTAERLINNWVSGSILDFALSCSVGLTNFVTSTETTDLPSTLNNYNYGTGLVMKRSDTFIYVELHPYNTSNTPIARNTYNNGTWYGWSYDYSEAYKPTASDVGAVPKTGGTFTGNLTIAPTNTGSEGGEIALNASSDSPTLAGSKLDNFNSTFRIFGIPSADGKTKTGVGIPLVIDPYAATITGGYTITGNLNGTATKAIQDGNGKVIADTYAPSGYGLGENVAANTSDINAVTPARFFRTTSSTANLTQATRNVGIVIPYATDEVAQILIRTSTGSVRIRRLYNDSWFEEWVNPPMSPDTEYRTVEKVNGKAVYKKADSSGKISYRLDGETDWKSYSVLVGALPISGGTLTGDLSINNSINLTSSSQGGNIQIIPPSTYGINYWEADAYNGNLRLFAQRSDSSYVFPLTLRSDGGIEISNAGCYGDSLPAAGTKGRIFFKKV